MSNGKAHTWKRVTATWPRHMRVQQPVKPAPAYPAFLAAPPQRTPPVPGQRPAKTRQHPPVPRHAAVLKPVVLKVASHHSPRPLAGLGWPRVHPRPQLALYLRQLRPHPLPHRPAPNHKAPALPVDLANMREPQKIEGFRLAFPTTSPVRYRPASELDQPRLRPMQLQPELRQPFPEFLQKSFGLGSALESQHEIIRVPHENYPAVRRLLPPGSHPQIENVRAASRTPSSPGDTAARCCARPVRGRGTFSVARLLPSRLSADGSPPLFESFLGTTSRSDSSVTCAWDVRP